jgi:hypothetical protein
MIQRIGARSRSRSDRSGPDLFGLVVCQSWFTTLSRRARLRTPPSTPLCPGTRRTTPSPVWTAKPTTSTAATVDGTTTGLVPSSTISLTLGTSGLNDDALAADLVRVRGHRGLVPCSRGELDEGAVLCLLVSDHPKIPSYTTNEVSQKVKRNVPSPD